VAFQSQAAHKRITLQSHGTAAIGAMVTSKALGIQGTRIAGQAGIDALAVQALLVTAALVIRLAANGCASKLGISGESGLAVANRVVVLHRALGIRSAVARTCALGVDAGLIQGALGAGLAANQDDIRCWNR